MTKKEYFSSFNKYISVVIDICYFCLLDLLSSFLRIYTVAFMYTLLFFFVLN